MPTPRASSLPLCLLVLACARHTATQPAPDTFACPVPNADASTALWRVVRTPAFDFCVPPDWRRDGITHWAGGANDIRWSIDKPLVPYVAPRAAHPMLLANDNFGARCPDPAAHHEQIGTHRVDLANGICGGLLYTMATWHGAHLYFLGTASSPAAVDTELSIYRTVRLPTDR